VCGAISGDLEHSLTQAGIFVEAFVAGEAEHVLRELLAGDFTSPSLCMPGARQRRKNMPGRDGTGPLGQGAMTGGGRGWCSGGGAGRGPGRGLGRGAGGGRGPGRGRGFGPWWRLDQEESGGADSLAKIADRMSEVLRELENRVAKLEDKKGDDDK
jgi:hypothetical protein